MSKLEKLYILGVRSFDNQRSETIKFQTPLTLIVGMNGSGKTTIIECLKYATTGELPAYGKQGNFVHDPKLCGEKEVLANIKLSFKSVQGTRYTISRSQQLTVKKTGRSCKTLDGTLKYSRDGEVHTLSQRTAELNGMLPELLGVSKAVLESVIFCHQEESLWPLEDSKKLKDRFDAIFEAVKYTKAIDSIKKLRKEKAKELALFQKDEELTKIVKVKAEENQQRTEKLHNEIEGACKKRDGIGEREKAAGAKSEEFREMAARIGEIVGRLIGKRIEERTKDENVRSLRENITEVSDSDEALQTMLEQYEERVGKYHADLVSQKERYSERNEEIKETRKRILAKERDCGTYEAQKKHYDNQVEARQRLVKETARSHDIRGFDMKVGDAQVQAFMDRIAKMARDQNAALERAREETREETRDAQKVLNQISEERTTLRQSKENAKQTINANDAKIRGLHTQLNQIDIDEGSKAEIKSKLRDTEQQLKQAKSDRDKANWDRDIDSAEAEVRQLESRKDRLNEELVEGTRQAGDSARLDFIRGELKDRQSSLKIMEGAHGDKIASIVGQGWKAETLDKTYRAALEHAASQVAEAERQRDGTAREKEQLEYRLNNSRDEVKSNREALNTAKKNIRDAMDIEPDEYTETVRGFEHSRDVAKSDASAFSSLFEYFDSCLKAANEHGGCRSCARPFKNDQEKEKMRKTLEREKKRFESSSEVEKDLQEAEEALKEARAASSDYETWKKAKEEIPTLEQTESEHARKREQLILQLEDQDAMVSERQNAKRDIEAIGKTVQNITKYTGDIATFQTQIEELAAKQKATSLSRGLKAIQDDIKSIDADMKVAKSRLSKSTGDRDRSKNTISKLELDQSKLQSTLSAAVHQLEKKASLESQVEEYKNLSNEQRGAIKAFDQDLQGVQARLAQAEAQHEDVVYRGADRDRELQSVLTKIKDSESELRKADENIKAYIKNGGPEQLARGKREAEELTDDAARLEEEQGLIVKEVKELERQLHNHKETKRNITDNQRYRRDLRQLQAVRAEIVELESHNAEEDKERYDREAHRWEVERNKLASDRARLTGSLGTMDQQLQQLMSDYESEYKNAARKHKEAHIIVETTKACVEDLGRYGGALDRAVMKYHSLKMEEINSYIAELWHKTYQGTDVDTICIRSESEGAKNTRSHNYRVVMIKQDAEMDMRGRCSAGQKVLASIIIRLALAEAFAQRCGIMALDEPTTNLDRDNIGALAESLHRIVQERRKHSNLQLIVITHDEEFLHRMNCGDFADTYYRVSRNERQKSVIEMQNISEVM